MTIALTRRGLFLSALHRATHKPIHTSTINVAVSLERRYKYQTVIAGLAVKAPPFTEGALMWTLLKRLWHQESGQDATEYALLVAMIALIVIAAVYSFGQSNSGSLNTTANTVAASGSSGGTGAALAANFGMIGIGSPWSLGHCSLTAYLAVPSSQRPWSIALASQSSYS